MDKVRIGVEGSADDAEDAEDAEDAAHVARDMSTPQNAATRQDTAKRRGWLATGGRLVRDWAPPVATAGGAVGIGVIIERATLLGQLDNALLALSFDSARVLLIDRATIALVAALVAALLSRRRAAAWAGATLFFLVAYLLPFVQSAQHPPLAPGIQVRLLPGALRLVAFQLACLGGTMAALGAAVGGALNDALVVPVRQIIQWMRHWPVVRRSPASAQSAQSAHLAQPRWALATLAAGLLLVGMVAVSVQRVGDVLTFGPTNTLYTFESVHGAQNAAPGSSDSAPLAGTIVLTRYASASLHGAIRTAYIYLPPSYATHTTERYPTLYLLHGSPGGPHDWLRAAHAALLTDALVAAKKMRETILVFPDGNGPVIRYSEWANSYDGRQMIEDAIVRDLVVYVDSHYRTLASPAFRAIGGLSEGGYGAANIALHHPEVFGAALCLSGYYLAQGPVFGGSSLDATAYRRYNSPLLFIQTAAGQRALQRVVFIIGDGTSDGFYLRQSILFTHALQGEHARVTLLTTAGNHSWTLWTTLYAEAAPQVEPV